MQIKYSLGKNVYSHRWGIKKYIKSTLTILLIKHRNFFFSLTLNEILQSMIELNNLKRYESNLFYWKLKNN